jgi:hypothetical protein
MKSELFESLYQVLLKNNNDIEVCITTEGENSNNISGNDGQTICYFFDEFIFSYGLFHELLEESKAIGDYHKLIISLIDSRILMVGTTFKTGEWGDGVFEEPNQISFKWTFDRVGNVI